MLKASPRALEETCDGQKIFSGRVKRCRARDAQAQPRNTQERPKREKGDEPQAGDRDWPLRSASEGKESPAPQFRTLVRPTVAATNNFIDLPCRANRRYRHRAPVR